MRNWRPEVSPAGWRGQVLRTLRALLLLACCGVPLPGQQRSCPSATPDGAAPCVMSGTTITLRLMQEVGGTDGGDAATVTATVAAPVIVDGRIAIGPGTQVWGRWARGRHDADGRPVLQLAFDSLAGAGGSVPLATRITNIDNARETVDSAGHITGAPADDILHTRTSWMSLLLGVMHPLAGAALLGESRVHAFMRHRPIRYDAGTELTAVTREPVVLRGWSVAAPLPPLSAAELGTAGSAEWPMRVGPTSLAGSGDPFNIAILGDSAGIAAAFRAAGWDVPERMTVHADLVTFIRAAEKRGYAQQPVSLQELNGQPPSLVFQKVGNTFAKRHHIRLWRWSGVDSASSQTVYLAAATHDVGITFNSRKRRFAHRVDPAIDAERDKVLDDLWFAGCVAGRSSIARPLPDTTTVNQGRDVVVSDGRIAVVTLRTACVPLPVP